MVEEMTTPRFPPVISHPCSPSGTTVRPAEECSYSWNANSPGPSPSPKPGPVSSSLVPSTPYGRLAFAVLLGFLLNFRAREADGEGEMIILGK